MDKIIIRNSFHHFLNKEEMLGSIKKSPDPDGDLYIFDPIPRLQDDYLCRKAIEEKEIKSELSKNGFQLVKEKDLKTFIILHYKIAG